MQHHLPITNAFMNMNVRDALMKKVLTAIFSPILFEPPP